MHVDMTSIQFGSIRTFCPLGHILIWGIRTFCPLGHILVFGNIRTFLIHKDLELSQVLMSSTKYVIHKKN